MAKDIMRINPYQIRIGNRIDRHAGNHAHAQSESHIGFNNIRVGRGKDNTRLQPRAVKRGVEF
ncbi:hypothetical protein D3C73_1253840 [compost metagenome]